MHSRYLLTIDIIKVKINFKNGMIYLAKSSEKQEKVLNFMNKKILITAAEKNIQRDLESLILEMGNIVQAVFSSAQKAVEYILSNSNRIDLIILSSFVEDGVFSFEFAEKLKSKYELPIILLNNEAHKLNFEHTNLKNGDFILNMPENKVEAEIFKYNLKEIVTNIKLKQQSQLSKYSLNSLSDYIAVLDEKAEKEQKLEAIFKSSQNISFIITEATSDKKDALIREFSPGAENIFGYSREKILDTSVSKLHCKDETRQFPNIHTLIQDGKSWSDEVVLIRKNGEKFPAILTVYPISDYADEKLLTLGVAVDISERKEVEEKLKKSKKLYQGLIESQNDLIVRVDSENRFTFVNDAYCELFGKKRKELIGSNFTPLVHEDDLESTLEAMKDLRKPPYRAHMEQRAMTVAGWRWISWEDNAVLNEMGEITEIQGVGRDITHLKETEKALKESQRKLEQLISQTTAVIYSYQIADGEHQITYLNENLENVVGFKPEDFIGKKEFYFSCVHPEDREILKEKIEKTTIKDNSIDEYRFKDKEGNYHWLYDHQKVVSREDGVIKVIGSWLDYTTEHKQHEERIDQLLYTDFLTGLKNRKHFEENEIITSMDKKRNLPLSVIKADINGLKLVNYSYGDDLGDQYLIKVAQILEDSVPEQAVIARWGGDEFLLLLPKTDKVEVQKILTQIREKMFHTFIKKIPLSMGLGTATKFDAEQSMEAVLKEADDLMYQNKLLEKNSMKSKIVESIINALAAKSDETKEHAMRLSKNARELGLRLGFDNSELDRVSLLAKLHDIGKTTISEEILTKPAKLNQKEWETIKNHPRIGYKIASASSDFSVVAEEILSHHERWDGGGYPRGLKAEDIPYLARIISIIDAYDVMTNERPYSKAVSKIDALVELKRCAGSQFDPQIAEEFITMLSE